MKLFTIQNILIGILYTFNLQAQTPEIWGMTARGGSDEGGVIFRTDSGGNNYDVCYSFPVRNAGGGPVGELCQYDSTTFYGVLQAGGKLAKGVLFRYDANKRSYKALIHFNDSVTGFIPSGGLVKASNGKLYGLNSRGGINNMGTIFEYDPRNDSFATLFHFSGLQTGKAPTGSLLEFDQEILFGITASGGVENDGVIFEYNLKSHKFRLRADFGKYDNNQVGRHPVAGLTLGTDSQLYGVTKTSGPRRFGTVFKLNLKTDSLESLYGFGGVLGRTPSSKLVLVEPNVFYGVTSSDGLGYRGTLFSFNSSLNQFKTLKYFGQDSIGSYPNSNLLLIGDHKIVGTTQSGGLNDIGTIYKYDYKVDSIEVAYHFNTMEEGNSKICGLVKYKNELFLGLGYGGKSDGVIYEFDFSNGSYNKTVDLNYYYNGCRPNGGLMQASDAMLYGMTQRGGFYNRGVIFKINAYTKEYEKVFDFKDDSTGYSPKGNLIEMNGLFYGLANGGKAGAGTLIAFNPKSNKLERKADFLGKPHAELPCGSLIQGSNGNLFALSAAGGKGSGTSVGYGTLIEYDTTKGTLSVYDIFDGSMTGASPYGNLLLHPNGLFYGLTSHSGANNNGTLFSIDPVTKSIVNIHDFKINVDGGHPWGTPVLGNGGKIYFVNHYGVDFGSGVLIEYDPISSNLNARLHFQDEIRPRGELILSSNGKLYGMTYAGAKHESGSLYEFDASTGKYRVAHHFNFFDGGFPEFPKLIEITNCYSSVDFELEGCGFITSPSGKYFWKKSGVYKDTLVNVNGCDSLLTIDVSIANIDTSVSKMDSNALIANETESEYQWLDCDDDLSIIINEKNRVLYNSFGSGSFAVEIKKGNCVDTSSCHRIISTDLHGAPGSQVLIYPNPNSGFFHVNARYEKLELLLFSIDGRQLLRKTISAPTVVDVRHLNKGMYLMKLSGNQNSKCGRIVIE